MKPVIVLRVLVQGLQQSFFHEKPMEYLRVFLQSGLMFPMKLVYFSFDPQVISIHIDLATMMT